MTLRTWARGETHFKSDEPGRVSTRRARKAVDEAAWRACCKAVDARDRGRCRCCGRRGNPESTSLLDRLHRHHIVLRSRGGEHDSATVASICADCHSDVHRHVLDIRGNADEGLEFWRLSKSEGWYLVRREVAPGIVEKD